MSVAELGWWKCNDNAASTTVLDASGNALHGTAARNTSLLTVAGKVGTALSFNGSSDKITLPDTALLDFGDGTNDSPFSVSCWVYWIAGYCNLLDREQDNSNLQYVCRANASRQFGLFLYDEVSTVYQGRYSAGAAVPSAAWAHVAATYDGRGGSTAYNGINLYVNGVNVNHTTASGGTYVAMHNTGAIPGTGWHYSLGYSTMRQDDLRVYNVALTPGQVNRLTAGGYGTPLSLAELYAPNSGIIKPLLKIG